MEIVIDENGNVVAASTINRPQLLQSTALQATKQWKSKPTLLNGIPSKGTRTTHLPLYHLVK